MVIPNIWENKECSKPPTSLNVLANIRIFAGHTHVLLLKHIYDFVVEHGQVPNASQCCQTPHAKPSLLLKNSPCVAALNQLNLYHGEISKSLNKVRHFEWFPAMGPPPVTGAPA